ncbi:MAG: T9SS type A sorting domain-containing protein [Ignavibacteriales bacterium]|nr:MAG: T9SS type A sorting domain-containing protein [Ignavibacteriales bacterium]
MFPDNTYATLTFIENERNINFIVQYAGVIIFFFVFCTAALGQWANNTSANTQLVVNSNDPINISTLSDGGSGFFILWEDSKIAGTPEIRFLHIDNGGNPGFRADGKSVTISSIKKSEPVGSTGSGNTMVVAWKDYSANSIGQIFVQRVDIKGYLLWGENGLQVSGVNSIASDYAVQCNNEGTSFISYVSKASETGSESSIMIQKISADGRLLLPGDGIKVHNSRNRKSFTSIVADDSGGAFIFWTENINNKTLIHSQHIDASNKLTFIKKPLLVTGQNSNVLKYSVYKADGNNVYLLWQLHKGDANIKHQLLNISGKLLWKENSLQVSVSGTNPQAFISGEEIFLSWTDESNNSKDIFVQKYNFKGEGLWKKPGINVNNLQGDQFGQRITGDENGDIITTWIDRRIDSLYGNVYVQKINNDGGFVWDENGIAAGTYTNSLKSYLSILPDRIGGAIIVFKDKREKLNNIYAQKIFSSGTFVSQITNFSTEISGDSVRIKWQSANEGQGTTYNIERTNQLDESGTYWSIVGSIPSAGSKDLNKYTFYDRPLENGTIYYRITQSGSKNFTQTSEIIRLNYFENSSEITVAQNIPNPFSDSTMISFYLPAEMLVTVEFFDLNIQKVGEIVKEKFPAGTNKITFVAKDIPSGIYFYRFKAGDVVEVKKMVVSK